MDIKFLNKTCFEHIYIFIDKLYNTNYLINQLIMVKLMLTTFKKDLISFSYFMRNKLNNLKTIL